MNRRDFLNKVTLPSAIFFSTFSDSSVSKMNSPLFASDNKFHTVASYDELSNTSGEFYGQVIYLTSYYTNVPGGGGFYSWKEGVESDDLGHVCVPKLGNGYWESLDDKVDLHSYGILAVNIDAADKTHDMSNRLQNAFNRAKSKNYSVHTSLAAENHYSKHGFFITKGINISGVKSIYGCLSLFLLSSEFKGLSTPGIPSTKWALININAKFDSSGMIYGSAQGNQIISSIVIRDLTPRSTSLSGQLHVFSGVNVFGSLCSVGFDGYGVCLDSCYDSFISDIRAISCGNSDYFAISCGNYPSAHTSRPDGFNSVTIAGVMAHDCYDRSIHITGAGKNRIERIHEEQTIVTSTTPWKKSATVITNNWGYSNTIIGGDFSSFGTVSIYPRNNCSKHHVCTIVSNRVAIDTLDTSGNVSIHSSYTEYPRALAINSLSVKYNLWISEYVIASLSTVEITEGNFDSNALRVTSGSIFMYGHKCHFYAKNGTFDYLSVNGDVHFDECNIVGCNVKGTVLLSNNNYIGNVTCDKIAIKGSRNYIQRGVFKNDVLIAGIDENHFSDCKFLGNIVLCNGVSLSKCFVNGLLTLKSIKGNSSSIMLKELHVKGDLIVDSTNPIKLASSVVNGNIIINDVKLNLILDDLMCGDIFNSAADGSWIYSKVIVSGSSNHANTIANTNIPRGRVSTTDPYTGNTYTYTGDGWVKVF
ncbi:TPA: hypothetical protein L9224_004995 [Klebsiella pneumoniae]|uniref:hypothetical protein n=1 Tax=Klebsiella pneumoniae TaxID=573 RepID=UPI0009D2348D|nr:hypothetical protein [Klebsiella pneumoniae]SLS03743.1 Uncharacterised protein [Klebsiella pneumoniae]HBR6910243.1 hypothetical protein [Klebsiella pneumoniae]HCM6410157.1 hypothetical protein [Klebsiella pneumoniae]